MPTTRDLAIITVLDIWDNGRKPKEAIEKAAAHLDDRERSFLMELVYGLLRYRDTLDWALRDFLKKPRGLGDRTVNNLRLAAYQIMFMRVPEWAAVNEAVEMEKRGGRPALVNAVLRGLLRRPPSERTDFGAVKKKGPVPYISLTTSHPAWLVRKWVRRFGESGAAELAEANNKLPPLTVRVNTLKSTRDRMLARLAGLGIRCRPAPFSPVGIKLAGFDVLKDFSDFRASLLVQDEASQLVTYLLDPQPGERVLDACAAPGGKTSHMAQLMQDKGEIIAIDTDRRRMEKLRENVSNLGLRSVNIMQADVENLQRSGIGSFDRILLDAPCSSLGVIRRNPDVKYRLSREDIRRLKTKQAGLLRIVSELLRPGGVLVYSVCSTEPEEGEEVIKEFLNDSKDFYIIESDFPFLKDFMKAGFFRTYPHIDDMDGFFGVKVCRKA